MRQFPFKAPHPSGCYLQHRPCTSVVFVIGQLFSIVLCQDSYKHQYQFMFGKPWSYFYDQRKQIDTAFSLAAAMLSLWSPGESPVFSGSWACLRTCAVVCLTPLVFLPSLLSLCFIRNSLELALILSYQGDLSLGQIEANFIQLYLEETGFSFMEGLYLHSTLNRNILIYVIYYFLVFLYIM